MAAVSLVVSDFSLSDAIESGADEVPQLVARDRSGNDIPGYFNIWQWILPRLWAPRRARKSAAQAGGGAEVGEHPINILSRHVGRPAREWKAR